jgi:hypothetical protein
MLLAGELRFEASLRLVIDIVWKEDPHLQNNHSKSELEVWLKQ